MHIKNIIISGFRSYREQAFPEELSPKHNVIVGRNGSGKSNFFAAVQFVLSEKFANLRANERKELFHVGAGRPALSVFVEIVFDNSDGRLVVPGRPEESEIRIRRTLGLKQDEFRVNDRKFSAAEVRQLLESAGFSSSNPYYIVEQGKIVNLANMAEEERYQLLKEVAGTKVYESRRAESEQILEETKGRQEKIAEAVQQIDDRRKELEAETSELKAFQESDRKRKSIEFCIFNNELLQAKEELDRLETNWGSRVSASTASHEAEANLQKDVVAAQSAANDCSHKISQMEAERKLLEKERSQLISRKAVIDLKISDASGTSSRNLKEQAALQKEAQELSKSIEKCSNDLQAKKKLLQTQLTSNTKAQDQLTTNEVKLETLQAKRGRKGNFKSKADRDSWIKDELKRNNEIITTNNNEIQRLDQEIAAAKTIISAVPNKSNSTQSSKKTDSALSQLESLRAAALAKRDKLNAERRRLWQIVNEQEGVVRRLAEDQQYTQSRLDRAIRHDIRQGLSSLREVLAEMNDPRLSSAVHGQLIELFRVEEGFESAVEVTAGNALFNIVVDSFDVSAKLLDYMNRRKKPGRVTFFPLDTCKSLPKDLPTTADVSPLLSHIKFDKKFKSVFAELFGKTLVASSLEVGASAVREFDCDVVTSEGDQFNRKGGITGGFMDKRATKLLAFTESVRGSEALKKEQLTLENLCQQVANVEQEITAVLQELDELNAKYSATCSSAENDRSEIRYYEERKARAEQQITQALRTQEALKRQNAQILGTNDALKSEVSSDFNASLSAQEEQELERLQSTVGKSRTDVDSLHSSVTQLTTDVQLLQDTLHHLERRHSTVLDHIDSMQRSTVADTSVLDTDAAAVQHEIKILDERLTAIEKQHQLMLTEKRKREEHAESVRLKLIDVARSQQEVKDAIDRTHNQRALLLHKKDEAQMKIRRLGMIPADADKFSTFSTGKLMHMLKAVNEELKKYEHVNKKALDQYTSLVETRNELVEKQKALEKELEGITNLMQHLDQKKDEAIERTYKQVQFQFEEVFKELVHTEGAEAELHMVKNPDRKSPDPYSAVRIKVSFGLGSAVSELAQLSGGQKSLIALALIFAIQRCDPAPFYLFDEIDAALDAEYRTSVAQMLKRQAENCQFITATFKTEMLDVADKVLGIFFHNKVSRIQTISADEGTRLLRQAVLDERKRLREGQTEANEGPEH